MRASWIIVEEADHSFAITNNEDQAKEELIRDHELSCQVAKDEER